MCNLSVGIVRCFVCALLLVVYLIHLLHKIQNSNRKADAHKTKRVHSRSTSHNGCLTGSLHGPHFFFEPAHLQGSDDHTTTSTAPTKRSRYKFKLKDTTFVSRRYKILMPNALEAAGVSLSRRTNRPIVSLKGPTFFREKKQLITIKRIRWRK